MVCVLLQLTAMFLWPVMSVVREDPYWDINAELQWTIPGDYALIIDERVATTSVKMVIDKICNHKMPSLTF